MITEETPEPEDPRATLRSIQRLQRYQVGAVIALTISVVLFALIYVVPHVSQASDALCTFRADLQSRVTQTQDYLRLHPEGFPGVSPETMQTSLAGQVRTVASLSSLSCPPAPPPVPLQSTPPSTTSPQTTPR